MLDRFHTIIVGVDGSDESVAALEQARRLLASDGTLIAFTVCEKHLAAHAGFDAPRVAAEIHAAADAAQAKAHALLADLPQADVRLVHGRPTQWLLAAAAEQDADLVAVGSHEHSRSAAIALGSVASEILHRAPQSVLVARRDGGRFEAIVAGVDGSHASMAALDVARELAGHAGVELRVLAAEGGKSVEIDPLVRVAELEWDTGHPVAALVGAAREDDLLVIGSRGLHGLASLGSVSERVAHRAPCSVLVVRALPRTARPSADAVSHAVA